MPYGNLLADVVQSSITGTPPQFNDGAGTQTGTLCRAWVNYNGVSGSQAIRASFNISSVTYNSTGDYTLNFTNALTDANYCTVSNGSQTGANIDNIVPTTRTTTAARFTTFNVDSTPLARDYSVLCIAIFR